MELLARSDLKGMGGWTCELLYEEALLYVFVVNLTFSFFSCGY